MRMVLMASKATVYGRSLLRGDEFDCPEKEAKLWSALARAKQAGGDATRSSSQPDDIDALRSRYRTMRGQDPDMRWGVGRLQKETAGAGIYNRRDMRAED